MSTHAVARTFYWFYASTNKNVEKVNNTPEQSLSGLGSSTAAVR